MKRNNKHYPSLEDLIESEDLSLEVLHPERIFQSKYIGYGIIAGRKA